MDEEPDKIERIFSDAANLWEPAERAAFLAAECHGDYDLRAQVERLLRHDAAVGSFLDLPDQGPAATIASPTLAERPGTQIGPYKLVEEIGEGGMGIVYMAVQKEPVRRKVALKIIKPGMDTREVIARFGAEEQALAMMDHPNIAKVHDAGTTESGRPYFVMELVNGVTLTQYCDDNNLTTDQRMELFVSVCHAVQHAHQKGIIHRDIKPSNILVTLHDGVPVPKIIDFGIAKAIGGGLTSETMATGYGQMIGTPLYMSPEQAERSGLDIDTRTDIYSLGVLLYELLTGSTPFDKAQFKDAALDEVRRLIREQEPPRPSTRISTMGMAATTVSEHRRTSPVELSNSLRHELDWIVMKALEKDRARRYETANDFARDIQRYLRDEAVEACPPSTIYRLRKFTRRHQTAAIATAAISLALLLGAGIAAGQAVRATKAEKVAEEQLQIANEQRRLAKEQAQLAQKQKQLAEEAAQRERDLRTEADTTRQQAEKVTDFLVEIFRSPDPERDGRTITVAEMLDKARTRVETEFKDDQLLKAKLLKAIGETYSGLGLVRDTTELAKRSYDIFCDILGPQHPDTLAAMQNLADAYRADGRLDEALPLTEETLRLRKEVLGPEHPDTLMSTRSLARAYESAGRLSEALRLCEETLRLHRERLGLKHRDTLESMSNLAGVYRQFGRWKEALRIEEETLQLSKEVLGPGHRDSVASLANLAVGYADLDRLDAALPLFEQALELQRKILGPEHPETLTSVGNLAAVYTAKGWLDKALPLLEETLKLRKEKLGPEHRDAIVSMNALATCYWNLQQLDRSIPLFEEALRLSKRVLGEDHPVTLSVTANLAVNYESAGRLDDAVPLFEQTFRLSKERLGPGHPSTLAAMRDLARAYHENGRSNEAITVADQLLQLVKAGLDSDYYEQVGLRNGLAEIYWLAGQEDEAEACVEETVKRYQEKFGREHPRTLTAMNDLGCAYWQAKKLDRSIPLFEEALRLQKKTSGEDDLQTLLVMANLGQNYRDAGRLDQAIALLEEGLKLCKKKLGPEHSTTLIAMNNLAGAYEEVNRQDKALSLYEETLRLHREKFGAEHPDTLRSMYGIAVTCSRLAQFDRAIPLFEETLRLRKKVCGEHHPDTLVVRANLGAACTAAGRLDQAVPLLEETLNLCKEILAPGHPTTLHSMYSLADAYRKAGRRDEALRLLEAVYRAPTRPPSLRWVGRALLDGYVQGGKSAEATALVKELLAPLRQSLSPDSPELAGALAQFSLALLQVNAFTDAESLLCECVTIREKAAPDDWRTFNTKSMLGGALLGQAKLLLATDAAAATAKLAEAEPLLVQGYEGMQQRDDKIPPAGKIRLTEALQRLIDLYTAWGKPDEAARWQEKLDALKGAAKPESGGE